jgi:hypothetical protein
MFVNLKLDKFNEIIFVHKLLNINQLKARKIYIVRLSFHCPLYIWVNGSRYEGTSFLHCDITLNEAILWVDGCASGASYWLPPNELWLSLSLLEELALIQCSQRAINFSSGTYINLWKKLNNFDFFKKIGSTSPIYGRVHHHSIHLIIWLMPCHVFNSLSCHE